MHPTTALITALATGAMAVEPAGHEWARPKQGDRRSPCPMVNTLANHGYLPRDGFNVSMQQFIDGLTAGINLEPKATQLVVSLGLNASTTGNPNTLNLDDLDKHLVIEHDGSLSRNDAFLGDNHSFNATIFNQTAAQFIDDVISLKAAARARSARLSAAKAANPGFNMRPADVKNSGLETALYMRVLGGPQAQAKRDWVNILFREERLPFNEGFSREATPITASELLQLTGQVLAS